MKYLLKLDEQNVSDLNNLRIKGETLKVRQRAGVLYFRNIGKSISQIMSLVGVSNKTVVTHIKNYIEKGESYIYENNYKGQVSELEKFTDLIKKEINENLPTSLPEAREVIKKATGIERSTTQIRNFLKKNEFYTLSQNRNLQKQTK
jgi:transposase